MIEYKFKKYIEKYNNDKYNNIYIDKLATYTLQYMMGGDTFVNTNTYDKKSILNFLDTHIPDKNVTKNKYAIIAYGPPGSGKSFAKKIGSVILSKMFKENVDLKDMPDIDKDKISYQSLIYTPHQYKTQVNSDKINCKDMLQIAKKLHGEIDTNILYQYDNPLTKQIYAETSHIYNKCRSNVDLVYELMYYMSMTLRSNFILEVANSEPDPVIYKINNLLKKNYKIIVVYPNMKQINNLIINNVKRGIDEWRFVPHSMISNIYEKAKYGSTKIFNFIQNANDPNLIYVEYDATFQNSNMYSHINMVTDDYIYTNITHDIIRSFGLPTPNPDIHIQ